MNNIDLGLISRFFYGVSCPKEEAANRIVEVFKSSLEAKDPNTALSSTNMGVRGHTFICSLPLVNLLNTPITKVSFTTASQAKGQGRGLLEIAKVIEILRGELQGKRGEKRKKIERNLSKLCRLYKNKWKAVDKTKSLHFILKWASSEMNTNAKECSELLRKFGMITPSIYPIDQELSEGVSFFAKEKKEKFKTDLRPKTLNFMVAFEGATLHAAVKTKQIRQLEEADLERVMVEIGKVACLDLFVGNDDRFLFFSWRKELDVLYSRPCNAGNLMMQVVKNDADNRSLGNIYLIDNETSEKLHRKEEKSGRRSIFYVSPEKLLEERLSFMERTATILFQDTALLAREAFQSFLSELQMNDHELYRSLPIDHYQTLVEQGAKTSLEALKNTPENVLTSTIKGVDDLSQVFLQLTRNNLKIIKEGSNGS
jgi:hypothetical protein